MNTTEAKLSCLAKSYNVLANEASLRKMLDSLLIGSGNLSKLELHEIISKLLVNDYKGEGSIKAKLVEMFWQQDVTAAFEMKVNSSRIDFITINGDTKSFEIKSNVDNLSKLEKQVSDYSKVFEYNYIVIDECHFKKSLNLIPEHYGIYLMEDGKLVRKKNANKNTFLEPIEQLKLLTKKELVQNFKYDNSSLENINAKYTNRAINEGFKKVLKNRYQRKWAFLKQNITNIYAIDYQFFFHHNIQPKIIYNA